MLRRSLTVALLLLAPALLAARRAAADGGGSERNLPEWAAALARPELDLGSLDASGRRLIFGHLQLELASGSLHPVRAGGRLVGAYFTGSGSFRYTSSDPVEAATYRENVERTTSYRVDAEGSVGDRIEEALILVSDDPEYLFAGSWTQGQAESGDAAARERFARHLERWRNDRGWRYPQLLPQALLDPPGEPLVVIEIGAERHDLHYVRDPLRDGDEYLAVMRKPFRPAAAWLDRRYPSYLSFLPLHRRRSDPRVVRFQLTELDVHVVNRRDREVRVSVCERFEARRPLRAIELRLDTSVTGTVGITGRMAELHYGLLALTDGEGRDLPYSLVDEDLVVQLPRPLRAGESVDLHFELAGDVLYRPNGDNYWHLSSAWYPTPPAWAMEAYSYHAVVAVPKPFIAFSTGRTVRRWEEGDLALAEFHDPGPMQGAMVLAGKYTSLAETRGERTVRVSSYARTKTHAMRRIADHVFDYLERMEPLLGRHPFPVLEVVEINAYGFGVAPAGMIFLTKEAFTPMLDRTTQLLAPEVDARIAHEVAHAWWGHVGQLANLEDQWLSEAGADYTAAWVLGEKRRRDFQGALHDWRADAKRVNGPWSVYLANYIQGEEAFAARRRLLYGRGPLVLHGLRREMGDPAFLSLLRETMRSSGRRPLWTRDFVDLAGREAGRDLRPWFDRYLFGNETPKF